MNRVDPRYALVFLTIVAGVCVGVVIDDLKLKLEHMNEILVNMQRARFGQSSEKQKYVSPDQLSVFNEAEAKQDPKAPEPDEKTT